MSRLASCWQILFIEEPITNTNEDAHWELERFENVTVCRPHTGLSAHGFNTDQCAAIAAAIPELLDQLQIREYAIWTYTPMAWPIIESLQPSLVVYDCMDELSKFLNAPPEIAELERRTLARCDVVFTGGRSLYRVKKGLHHNVHCFPSSVDAEHFAKAKLDLSEAPDQQAIPHPRLGYFGVIDERIDLPLIAGLADSEPEWQIILVGPVVKIDPAALPQRPNIHYLGQRDYQVLPDYLRGWDLCLLPFALNDSTKFISPTKTLEYMAAARPIVSTPITDVVDCYSHIVRTAGSAQEFISACRAVLDEQGRHAAERQSAIDDVLNNTGWDLTVAGMQAELENALRRKAQRTSASTARTPNHDHEAIVIGAGPTGLSAAYHLPGALLLEQGSTIGGWCRSLECNGFTFDFAGHIMFSKESYVHEMYNLLLGDNVHWQDREAWIYSHGVHTRYPFQGALYGLPPEVIKECIVGAIEARFGAINGDGAAPRSANGNGKLHQGAVCKNAKSRTSNGDLSIQPSAQNGHTAAPNGHAGPEISDMPIEDCCGDGVLESTCKNRIATSAYDSLGDSRSNGQALNGRNGARPSENFEQFIYRVWGEGIAKHFAIPYNRKLWAVPLDEMETSWLGGRVPMPDLGEMIDGALQPVGKPMGPNARFGYPLRGGFQALMDGFLPYVRDRLRLNSKVVRISLNDRELELDDGSVYGFSRLISTMPLPSLIRAIGNEAPDFIQQAVRKLRHVSVRCVHIGVGREKLTEKHWIYYPEDTVFHRIFVQGNASPFCNPPGGFGLTCEITYSPHKPLPCERDALINRCIKECRQVGIIADVDPIWAAIQVDLPYAYVVYDHDRSNLVKLIRDWLAARGVILAGRYSEWEYYNSDHAFIAGKRAADEVLSGKHVSPTTNSPARV